MVKCDANGNYIHPQHVKNRNEQVPSFQETEQGRSIVAFYNMFHKDIFMTSNHEG